MKIIEKSQMEEGQNYWIADPTCQEYTKRTRWNKTPTNYHCLKIGLFFTEKEEAQNYAKEMINKTTK